MAAVRQRLPPPSLLLLLFFFFFFLSPLLSRAEPMPPEDIPMAESLALLMLKESLGNPAVLSSWDPQSLPCDAKKPWVGVLCFQGIVTGLRLGGMGLSGKIDVEGLTHLRGLRTVSFVNNNFSGEIPPLGKLPALKSIFLSDNHFSGEIAGDFFADMEHLKKVWLSGNSFAGEIPASISKLPHLMELHLENNRFAGRIPAIDLPALKSFNVSNNDLEGNIPASLGRFGASSFEGNPKLCGPQLGGKPCAAAPPSTKEIQSGRTVVVCIVLVILLLALIAGVAMLKKRRDGEFDTLGIEHGEFDSIAPPPPVPHGSSHKRHDSSQRKHDQSSHKRHGSSKKGSGSSRAGAGAAAGMAELVMVNEDKGTFSLPDLMKASAEVLGNGGSGSAYKAVMANGVAVVVKRMREMNRVGKDGFEVEMRKLGRLRHPNVLTPLAYHYRKEEKLLVLEYVEKGSLLYLLHGDRGAFHAALDWPTRLKIVRGIARGMAYLHVELASSDVPHGNLKSGNVLLGSDFEPLIADYGFTSLVNPSQASLSMFAYKSPESVQYRHVSPKSDVYCLGVIILELMTGKFPSQYLNNGKGGTDVVEWVASAMSERREAELIDPEISIAKSSLSSMERLLRIGAACVEPNPDRRLDMREAARRIEEMTVEGRCEEAAGGIGSAPSLKDGYAELSVISHATKAQEGHRELTSRRSARESIGERSSRRDEENFGIS